MKIPYEFLYNKGKLFNLKKWSVKSEAICLHTKLILITSYNVSLRNLYSLFIQCVKYVLGLSV